MKGQRAAIIFTLVWMAFWITFIEWTNNRYHYQIVWGSIAIGVIVIVYRLRMHWKEWKTTH